jgi:hypothetical protein
MSDVEALLKTGSLRDGGRMSTGRDGAHLRLIRLRRVCVRTIKCGYSLQTEPKPYLMPYEINVARNFSSCIVPVPFHLAHVVTYGTRMDKRSLSLREQVVLRSTDTVSPDSNTACVTD